MESEPTETRTLPALRIEEDGVEVAQWCAEALRVALAGDDARDGLSPWLRAASRLRCRVRTVFEPGAGRGAYCPGTDGDGAIILNLACPLADLPKVLVHELAHHLMYWRVPQGVYRAAVVCCYEGDNGDFRHEIARLVETLLLGD